MPQGILAKIFNVEFKEHERANLGSDERDCLQVIGAGLPRCGTTSLKAALQTLGFGPCHHMVECLESPPRARIFTDLLRSQANDPSRTDPARLDKLRTAIRGFKAAVDAPTTDVYRELMAIYPSAKVILNVRDSPDACYPLPFMRAGVQLTRAVVEPWQSKGLYGPDWYRTHNEEVRKLVPSERLLEFNVKEVWGSLCKLLEVPQPDVPFPHLNDTKAKKSALKRMRLFCASAWLAYFSLAGFAGWLALRPPLFLQAFVEWAAASFEAFL